MKHAAYKVPKGVVDLFRERGFDEGFLDSLSKAEIRTPEAESDEEFLTFVENGDRTNMRKLAQGQLDIIRQRKIREYLESDEATKLAQEKGFDALVAEAQKVGDEYVYGARTQGTGAATVTRAKAAATDAALDAIDLSDTAKVERLRKLLGDRAVEALIAAKKAQDEQAAKKAGEAPAQATA